MTEEFGPLDRIREALATLPQSSPLSDAIASAAASGLAALPAGPGSAAVVAGLTGAFTRWHGGRRTGILLDRLQEVLWLVVEEIGRMQVQGVRVNYDDEYLELVETTVPIAMRTRNVEKRRRYAMLLAHASADDPSTELDQAETVAILLDQLEPEHIRLLDRLMTAPGEEEIDRSLGNCRWVAISDTGYRPETEAASWIRLHSLGLLNGAAQVGTGISHTFAGGLALSVAVTPLGLQLHRWITSGVPRRP